MIFNPRIRKDKFFSFETYFIYNLEYYHIYGFCQPYAKASGCKQFYYNLKFV